MKIDLNKIVALAIFAAGIPSYSHVKFGELDLNSESRLLFSAEHQVPGTPSYSSLFETKLGEQSLSYEPKLLTCFPEKMELLEDGKTLQIRNRYGTAFYSPDTDSLKWVQEPKGIPVEYTHTASQWPSPDGKWTCFVRQTKNAHGKLILMNAKTLEERTLVENAPFSYLSSIVKWSPDSKTVLYEKDNSVYFITPSSAFRNIQLPENYRKIGDGFINSVQWTSNGGIIYIRGDIVYRISENELYTRGLYSALVGNGSIAGRLPGSFDEVHDQFWCNGSGSQLVVLSKNNFVNYYSMNKSSEFSYMKINGMYPLTEIKGSPLNFNVIWSQTDGTPFLWIDMLNFETCEKISNVYAVRKNLEFVLSAKKSIEPVLSPDRKKIAFTDGDALCIHDVSSWNREVLLDGEKVHSVVWVSNSSLYVGGNETVRLWDMSSKALSEGANGVDTVLFLSSAENYFWNDGKVVCVTGAEKKPYSYDSERNVWSLAAVDSVSKPSEKNGSFRVFRGESRNRNFDNAIFVRSLSNGVKTYPVFEETERTVGSSKHVTLVFDVLENAEGLSQVLYNLNDFSIKTTFFLNGEFIRRYPVETNQIANSGHSTGSLFYSNADLITNNFVIDENFIKRGLARNEDEYFSATSRELSLVWHAPYYHSNELMRKAGEEAGYRYVDASTIFSDRITFEESASSGKKYMSASELIDTIVSSLENDLVIPVNIGKSAGTRRDYLFEKIDLLIASILDAGYEIN